jgi:hypothetical protein
MVSTLHQEEKGTDVNVASHLLMDVFQDDVDAVVVPVGQVNPRGGLFAGDLTGNPSDGAGRHWWRKLTPADFHLHQLPDPAGRYTKPAAW